ncbi:U3 snoRNP-associated protein Lcp5 [Schizosaccharomyces cryophilus OY26]|uniref:U3 snoRNP-associated protein Lcp5 n=1 Tax=Schizosaccharomyces cryophilus (strain OY26 / ATCC MYA-4695 / CBS 11777 / NBRC 106824 / NRRL Y48691) TaxID=653667 RepID=S9VYB0_SCHCR|nr:U3 snoRNP-associated protein Lcp5 [Schizosaccharomyces cryophilus OY26]EPY52653.1 U3 snoRNP-associated protein Lcp5 [Schizosaccharomyces cryophilus OY26]
MDVINKSLLSALDSLPKNLKSTSEGVSLVSLKTQLLLSYVQKLAFLILVKLEGKSYLEFQNVIEKLVRLRLEIEKVRPLENRIQYSLDKLLRAAERKEELESLGTAGLDGGIDQEDTDSLKLHYKPNLVGLEGDEEEAPVANEQNRKSNRKEASSEEVTSEEEDESKKDGVYRPPRIRAVTMDDEKRPRRRPNQLVDEFVSSDLSSLPQSMPSVGSNLERGGRVIHADERQLEKMRERAEYEESNYTRLPRLSKKELKTVKKPKKPGFGGEDWSLLDRSFNSDAFASRKLDLSSRANKRAMSDASEGKSGSSESHMGDAYRKRRKALKRR